MVLMIDQSRSYIEMDRKKNISNFFFPISRPNFNQKFDQKRPNKIKHKIRAKNYGNNNNNNIQLASFVE